MNANVNADIISAAKNYNLPTMQKNDLNMPPTVINDNNPNAILRMEVELRDKNQPLKKRIKNKAKQFKAKDVNIDNVHVVDVPMEQV